MRKSVRREYGLDRFYDFEDAKGYHNAKANVGFVKRRARRRLRHQCKINVYHEIMEDDNE